MESVSRFLIVAATVAFLAACQTTGGNFCDIAKPLRPSAETIASLTDAEVAAILSHNLKGKKICGWKTS